MPEISIAKQETAEAAKIAAENNKTKIGTSADAANSTGSTLFSVLNWIVSTWTSAKSALLDAAVTSRASQTDMTTVKGVVGQPNPTSGDLTTVMNGLKKISDAQGGVGLDPAKLPPSILPKSNVLTLETSGTWTVPKTGVYWVSAIAAGGKGAAASTTYGAYGGGGGACGQFVIERRFELTAGTVINYTVGTGNTIFGSYFTLLKGSNGNVLDGGIAFTLDGGAFYSKASSGSGGSIDRSDKTLPHGSNGAGNFGGRGGLCAYSDHKIYGGGGGGAPGKFVADKISGESGGDYSGDAGSKWGAGGGGGYYSGGTTYDGGIGANGVIFIEWE